MTTADEQGPAPAGSAARPGAPAGGAGAPEHRTGGGRAGGGAAGGSGHSGEATGPGELDPQLERARQRAHRFFRYAGLGYFALLALIPLILAWQGVLWTGLREMALVLLGLVVVLTPVAAVVAVVYFLLRAGRARGTTVKDGRDREEGPAPPPRR